MNGCGVVLRVESDKSCQEFSSIQLSSSQLQETLLCFVDNVLKKLEDDRLIQLPSEDEEVVERDDFTISRPTGEHLTPSQKMCDIAYITDCVAQGQVVFLHAYSGAFLPVEHVAKRALTMTKGDKPLVPNRDESLEASGDDGVTNSQIVFMAGGEGPMGTARGQQLPVRRRVKRHSEFSDIAHVLNTAGFTSASSPPDETFSLSLSFSDAGEGRQCSTPEESGSNLDQTLEGQSVSSSEGSVEAIVLRPPVVMTRVGSPPPMVPPPILEEPLDTDMDKPPPSSAPVNTDDNRKPIARKNPMKKFPRMLSLSYVFDKLKTFQVTFQLLDEATLTMDCCGSSSIQQIKDSLWRHLKMNFDYERCPPLADFVRDQEKFTLLYQKDDCLYELIDNQQIFQASALVQQWCRSGEEGELSLLLQRKRVESKQEQLMNIEISTLLGFGLYEFTFADNDELEMTRRKLVSVRRNAVNRRNPILYTMEPRLATTKPPQLILDKIQENKVNIEIHTTSTLQVKHYCIDMNTSGDQFLAMVVSDCELLGLSSDSKCEDFVVKVPGKGQFVIGPAPLINHEYVRRCLSLGLSSVRLHLVPRFDVKRDFPRELCDEWVLADESTGVAGTHQQLSALDKPHEQVLISSMWDIPTPFRIRIIGLDRLKKEIQDQYNRLYVEVGMYHGGQLLLPAVRTGEVSTASSHPRWNQWLKFDIRVKNLPKAARLHIRVLGRGLKEKRRGSKADRRNTIAKLYDVDPDTCVGDEVLLWVNLQVVDHRSLLRQGRQCRTLWPAVGGTTGTKDAPPMSPVGTTACNPNVNQAVSLHVELPSYAHPVACPTGGWKTELSAVSAPERIPHMMEKDLHQAVYGDPLRQLQEREKELLQRYCLLCTEMPEALPKYLQCVDWAQLDQVAEAHLLLDRWRIPTKEATLELLDYHYSDEKVRSMAVKRLEGMADDELVEILLQLVQVLKFEAYDDSALGRFLLSRALSSKCIGHYFFWYLKSEMEHPGFKQRFGILLEAYLRGCGEAMLADLRKQYEAVQRFIRIAINAKRQSEKQQKRNEFVRTELAQEDIVTGFSPIFDPGLKTGKLDSDKAKVMVSKKAPLWIEFENQQVDNQLQMGRSIKLIIKHGDDLRQDMLTLQMLRIMDKLWQNDGLYLHMTPYGCIATGQDQGIIEVVQNSETVAKIQQEYGGNLGAFKEDPIYNWLKKQNPNTSHFEHALERFMLSCAGYCVGTYVLGIGDRHNDNIMVSTSGNLFHIDFGHFLGNIKTKAGVKRDRAPFVLTPDFVYIMGGRSGMMFRRFEETSVKAYLILRQNANLFINLFSMMKCTGIPELQSVKDIEYLRNVFVLDKTAEEAGEVFREKIGECLRLAWTVQFNFWVHTAVTGSRT